MAGGRSRGRGPEELLTGRAADDATVELLTGGSTSLDPDADSDSDSGSSLGPSASTRLPVPVLVGGLVAVVALLAILARPGPSESAADDDASPPTTARPPTTPPPTTSPPTTPLPLSFNGPVLGEDTGFTLFLGGDTPLTAVDLDSGDVTRYGLTAHPILATGGELVLYQEDAGIVGWVPLDDPGQQALTWKQGRLAAGSGPGLVWVLDPTNDEPHPAGVEVGFGRWELFETASSRRVFRMPGDLYPDIERFIEATPLVGGSFEAFRPGPWFTTRRDGVYRAIEDGYTRVSGGRVLAVDEEAILIEQCTVDGFCDLAWVGVETGELFDRILPEVRPRVARLVAGGAWLHSVGWGGTSELLELATGRRIEQDWAEARPTISPDGSWLAHWSNSTLLLSDLRGGGDPEPVIGLELLDRGRSAGLLFAPTSPAPSTSADGAAASARS